MSFYMDIDSWTLECDIDDTSNRKPYLATIKYRGGYRYTDLTQNNKLLNINDKKSKTFEKKEEAESWIKEQCDKGGQP